MHLSCLEKGRTAITASLPPTHTQLNDHTYKLFKSIQPPVTERQIAHFLSEGQMKVILENHHLKWKKTRQVERKWINGEKK